MADHTGDGAIQATVYEGDAETAPPASEATPGRSRGPRTAGKTSADGGVARRTPRRSNPAPAGAVDLASPALSRDLREFASARPEGWNHEDWIVFLESLRTRGHDIRDRDAIGVALEMERLDLVLSSVRGLGPQRRRALVDRYGTLWTLRAADPNEIASVARIPVDLARKAREATI